MHKAIESILLFLWNRHYIGAKHFPEKKLIISRTKWLSKRELKSFERAYKQLLKNDYFIRLKKRTGKGSEYHLSINPKKLKEINELISND